MSVFIAALLRALILEAAAILGLVDAALRRSLAVGRARAAAYAGVALASWLAFLNFGAIHGGGQLPHWSEQYHFDLGDKYLRELRYDGLYLATFAAVAERRLPAVGDVRDPITFRLIPRDQVPRRAQEVRGRFRAERWAQFEDDLAALLSEEPHAASTGDHGNTASPAGALVPWALMQMIPLHGVGFRLLAVADLVVLGLAFVACWRWGSLRVAASAFCLALLAPYATDFLLGSLFRFDWLAAGLGATLALSRGRRATAGALFAYAALSRPFAAAFGLCAFFGLLGEAHRGEVDRRSLLRFAQGATGCAAALVLASTLVFGASIWPQYLARLLATLHEGYYGLSHGFRNVYAQIATDGLVAVTQPVPATVAAARLDPTTLVGLGYVQAILVALWLVASFRDGSVMGAGHGVLLVFATLVTNAYYQGMWGLLALACALHASTSVRARVGFALACVVFCSRYVMKHFGELAYAHDYFANWTTFAFGVVWLAGSFLSRGMSPIRRHAS